ncbi:MAG: hypothetical protein JNM14_05910 [Ferruginibacter sp.]|nr:hypothetical protein [Ferruginibacter sp.]
MFRKKKHNITASCIIPVLLAVISITLPIVTMAQGPIDPEDTPIDGGVSFLIAGGAAYGIRKYRKYKAAGKEA